MHELTEIGSIPAFIAKLWTLVDDRDTDSVISWSNDGQNFKIHNPSRFTYEILPKYFKHNNMASFIRQLNMYGFRKIMSLESGEKGNTKNTMEFSHSYFAKGHPYLLDQIKRKITAGSKVSPLVAFLKTDPNEETSTTQSEILAQVLNEINALKTKQASWDAKLASMKRENETLWRELAIFRQKHQKQAQIINKLIHFIVTMVQPTSRNVGLRRRYPLMLSDGSRNLAGPSTSSNSTGPTIRELDPAEFILGDAEKTKPRTVGKEVLVSPSKNKDNKSPKSPYMVLSPNSIEDGTLLPSATPSPWLDMDMSDNEISEMTPINPLDTISREYDESSDFLVTLPSTSTEPTNVPKVIVVKPKQIQGRRGSKAKKGSGKKKEIIQEIPESNTETEFIPIDENLIEFVPDLSHEETELPEEGTSDVRDPVLNAAPSVINIKTEKNNTDAETLALVRPGYVETGVSRDFESHVDNVQGELDIMKELLKSDGYTFDANSLLELLTDDPYSYSMPPSQEEKDKGESDSALITYNDEPNLLDLMDLYEPSSNLAASPPSSPIPSPPSLNTPISVPSPAKKRRK